MMQSKRIRQSSKAHPTSKFSLFIPCCVIFGTVIFVCSLKAAYSAGKIAGYNELVTEATEVDNTVEQIEVIVYNQIHTEEYICLVPSCLNKNPLNIKARAIDPWEGQVGADDQGHAVFAEYEYGIRAASLVLRSYVVNHGISTIRGIVNRFAEGNRGVYVSFLCAALDVRPDEHIDIIERMGDILKAMARFESGIAFPDKLFTCYDILGKPLTPTE